MASRIFVSGLPPSLTPTEFKKHFSTQGAVTDTKLFPERRIGYVGYTSPQEAEKAVKYFNRTFIRMSKLAVELARPITARTPAQHAEPTVTRQQTSPDGSKNLKRKRGSDSKMEDPKLREYLEVMQKGSNSAVHGTDTLQKEGPVIMPDENPSEDDVQVISRTKKVRPNQELAADQSVDPTTPQQQTEEEAEDIPRTDIENHTNNLTSAPSTDADWLRSRTNRTLDLEAGANFDSVMKDAQTEVLEQSNKVLQAEQDSSNATAPNKEEETNEATAVDASEPLNGTEIKIRESSRLYLRNLSYGTTEDDLRGLLSGHGELAEVHLAIDKKNSKPKGFAFVLFEDPNAAVEAWKAHDGTPLNGRLLHILPGSMKRESKLDEFELSKLPHKKQEQIKRRREAATKTFNWNSLYMNQDAVISSVADRLGVDKSTLLDPTSSDAAVKQAHAETHVIQETKSYFKSHGVNLDSFSRKKRGDTAILVKNFPYDAKASELKTLFEQHGKLTRFLMPPSGTIAIIEFENSAQAKAAFKSLAYSRIKSSMLYLEFAPKDLFDAEPVTEDATAIPAAVASKLNATDLLQTDDIPDNTPTATLFVRNLNFSTTTNRLDEVFRPLDGFLSARVKTKTDPKKPGETLSMGFGFLEFRTKTQAQKALLAMDGYKLDGHSLQIRASHKDYDAAEERRQTEKAKKQASKSSKLVVKNLPFEATKKDVRSLLGAYGQLRSVRVPKKIGQSTRGFAFAEFTTPKEAENARDALQNTHLLGRRLVIDYAAEDPEDAEEEIEKMQNKVGSQLNKVAVQNLLGDGRHKFKVNDQGAEE
ncbi:RNA recognition motif-containing protein 2 [Elsinoe fawcettii]|nr:RNA recognition motif-containing protein 2 [Elsinoe fawcettii]